MRLRIPRGTELCKHRFRDRDKFCTAGMMVFFDVDHPKDPNERIEREDISRVEKAAGMFVSDIALLNDRAQNLDEFFQGFTESRGIEVEWDK